VHTRWTTSESTPSRHRRYDIDIDIDVDINVDLDIPFGTDTWGLHDGLLRKYTITAQEVDIYTGIDMDIDPDILFGTDMWGLHHAGLHQKVHHLGTEGLMLIYI